ncbi:PBSX family phage terminase large subunit [Anaerofustis stercorihominis]|uniref:PBSX family phage terminase large subunit n=1 Tax=Anaerofustis stercorihominis TaxID=214853 RepID=UPI0039913FF2
MIKLTEKQKEYVNMKPRRWNFKTGAVRSGKSFVDVACIVPERVIEREGLSGLNLIMGVSRDTIERNVLTPMREIYTEKRISGINTGRNTATIFGQEVYCLGAEKVSQVAKIQGISLKYCYGDEVTKWNKEVFEMVKSRLDKPYSCFDGTCNPENPKHWLKQFMDSDVDKYIQKYTIFDNDFLSKEFVKNLCNEYKGTVYYDRYILGEWKQAEGVVYPQYINNKEKYFIKDIDSGFKTWIKNNIDFIQIGVDFGGNKSFHTFVATGFKYDGSLMIAIKSVRLNPQGVSPQDLYKEFELFLLSILDYDVLIRTVYCDSAEQTLINGLVSYLRNRGYKIPVKNSIKKPIQDRIMFTNLLVATSRFFIYIKDCETLNDALIEAVYDDKKNEDTRLDDFTSDIDTLDAFEYSFESVMKLYERR